VEKLRISYSFPTSSYENVGVLSFPQTEEGLGFVASIGERRFLNIFTLSTTTNFFYTMVISYLDSVHNRAHTDAVEAQ
jgi:hypothetical protein